MLKEKRIIGLMHYFTSKRANQLDVRGLYIDFENGQRIELPPIFSEQYKNRKYGFYCKRVEIIIKELK